MVEPIRTESQDGSVEYRLNGILHRVDGPAQIWPDGLQIWYQNGQIHRVNGPARIFPDGTEYWFQKGKLHRANGPAVIRPNGSQEWFQNGKYHRTDGPAVISSNGTQEWYQNGQRHREDGPAYISADGREEWYQNDKRHRIGGPAFIRPDGTKSWYQNGLLHREDGPAVIKSDGTEQWWAFGDKVDPSRLVRRPNEDQLVAKISALTPTEPVKIVKPYNNRDTEMLMQYNAIISILNNNFSVGFANQIKNILQVGLAKVPDALKYLTQVLKLLYPAKQAAKKTVAPGQKWPLVLPKESKVKQLAKQIAAAELELSQLKTSAKPGDVKLLMPYFAYIEEHCADYLSAVRETKKLLLRGQKELNALVYRAYPRSDRRPSDSSVESQRYLDAAMKQHGFAALRSNSIFTTASEMQAAKYGEVYAIFPKDGFDFTWSERHKDLVLPGFTDDYAAERMLARSAFTATDIESALKSDHEVCVLGEYIAVNYDRFKSIIDNHFFTDRSSNEVAKSPPLSAHIPRENVDK